MGRPVGATRPRYRRITAAGSSLLVTLVAVLGGVGLLPAESPATRPVSQDSAASGDRASLVDAKPRRQDRKPTRPGSAARFDAADGERGLRARRSLELPEGSGEGQRVVFSMSAQRVWLVGSRGVVRRTYLVSGSVTDNLDPGQYDVYSRSEDAIGVDDSGTMKYMVRFAHGDNAAIGFHDIPVKDGEWVQSRAELGTPHSHGCIRQWRRDAKALWEFAPVGTPVVVRA